MLKLLKLADWLESYAQSMELNVWTSTTIHKIDRNPDGKGWVVHVTRADGSSRDLNPKNVVFAHGFGGGVPNLPVYPGQASRFEHTLSNTRLINGHTG